MPGPGAALALERGPVGDEGLFGDQRPGADAKRSQCLPPAQPARDFRTARVADRLIHT